MGQVTLIWGHFRWFLASKNRVISIQNIQHYQLYIFCNSSNSNTARFPLNESIKNPFNHQLYPNITTFIISTKLAAFKLKISLKDKTFHRYHKKFFSSVMDGQFRLHSFPSKKKNCIPRNKLQRGWKSFIWQVVVSRFGPGSGFPANRSQI